MAVLKKTVLVGFVLFGLISLIHACWLADAGGQDQCKDSDSSVHPLGSTWTNRYCVKCTCSAGYMVCCSLLPKSVTPGCTLKNDYKTCTYTATSNNPSVVCNAKFR